MSEICDGAAEVGGISHLDILPTFANLLQETPMRHLLRDTHFTEIAETKPDSKNRVTLGKLPMKAHHYKVFVNEAGQIVLDPQLSIPAAEMWLFENKKALASVVGGLADAKGGRIVKSKEDFAKYLDDK